MENIQVIVRVRPSNPMEREGNDLEIWQIMQGDTITISADRYNDLVRMRKFLPS
jgi:centromeric protein E